MEKSGLRIISELLRVTNCRNVERASKVINVSAAQLSRIKNGQQLLSEGLYKKFIDFGLSKDVLDKVVDEQNQARLLHSESKLGDNFHVVLVQRFSSTLVSSEVILALGKLNNSLGFEKISIRDIYSLQKTYEEMGNTLSSEFVEAWYKLKYHKF